MEDDTNAVAAAPAVPAPLDRVPSPVVLARLGGSVGSDATSDGKKSSTGSWMRRTHEKLAGVAPRVEEDTLSNVAPPVQLPA
jgi:hypothetical protein